ncbi:MAG: exonuclease SbcCD subunit D [Peptococcaceae bacterium]|jgi:exonuclease SbcD|nr:exonuclease SbcCD subunit D [Peptococcaceae bacterium]
MKFLHLADLHIGKSLGGFSMLPEQRRAFRQIIGYIRAEGPAAVVIAGDVYDRAVPGVEAVRAFDDFLTELAGEEVAVLLIAGNHDSPERLSYASRLLSERRLFIRGAFDGNIQKVTLTDEYGEVHFWLLPFIKPASVRGTLRPAAAEFGAGEDGGGEAVSGGEGAATDGEEAVSGGVEGADGPEDGVIDSYDAALAAALAAAPIDYTARNVLVSHQFYTRAGVTPVRSESELLPVGGLDGIDAGLIERFDYAALGHLHGAQSVGERHIRYAGSPVKYSVSEWKQKKSVTLVELGAKGAPVGLTCLPLVPERELREIKGEFARLMSAGASGDGDGRNANEDYLSIILTDEEEIIDPVSKLRGVYPNIIGFKFANSRTSVDLAAITAAAGAVERLSPYDLFSEFFLDVQGSAMSEAQAEIARELLTAEDEV